MSSSIVRLAASGFVALLAACGSLGSRDRFVARDSAGVAILAYPASAWDSTPQWQLSESPILILGGDSVDATMDLSTTAVATLFSDGRSAVYTTSPPEILLFNAAGGREARLASPGTGPGEYRAISRLFALGPDTLFAFDATQLKGLFFAANGLPLGERVLPPVHSSVPASLRGRLEDGTFLFSLDMVSDPAPKGRRKAFRNRLVVLGLNPQTDRYDTLVTSKGTELVPATVMDDGNTLPLARPLVFGAATQLAAGGNQWYLSTADRFEVETHDRSGKLLRVVRLNLPARPVLASDQAMYKATVRDVYDRLRGSFTPEAMAAELKRLDETVFADHFPAIAQLMTDPEGSLWVNRGFSLVDRTRSWIVLNAAGQPIGRVDTPLGLLLAISEDRVVVSRKNPVTSRVRLEVYGLTRNYPPGAPPPDSTKP
jgi:hypothetical protein